MATLSGNWLHSRSSSNLSELISVRRIVIESNKPSYAGINWSGGRTANPELYVISNICEIQPSTMQTKIRAMIRFGFIQEGNTFPLIWTRLGRLWNDLYSLENYSAAIIVYQITLIISLAIYAFNESQEQYSPNPINGELPLKFLLNNLDSNNSISLQSLSQLIDGSTSRIGKNLSYWKRDLLNSGLFNEVYGNLIYTNLYNALVNEIKNFVPNPMLDNTDWDAIRENPLIDISPFKISLTNIFENILTNVHLEEHLVNVSSNAPIVEAITEQIEDSIPDLDILNTNTRFATSTRSVRDVIWALRIKRDFEYKCAVTNCDVIGNDFVVAAHIKPYRIPDGELPHRSHILNGLSLCGNCHIAFDKGLFSLTDDGRVIVSRKFNEVENQNIKRIFLSSQDLEIKYRVDHRLPLTEFIQYHREHIFKDD